MTKLEKQFYDKEYRIKNKEKLKQKDKEKYIRRKEQVSLCSKQYYIKNRDKIRARVKVYATNNKDKINKYQHKKKRTDVQYRLRWLLRNRLLRALKGNFKVGSAVRDLGCSIQHLKLHLELFWDDGMSWDNYGNKEGQWSIDHIIPLSKFDLSNRDQFLEAVNFKNLQPLWHVDNLRKKNNV